MSAVFKRFCTFVNNFNRKKNSPLYDINYFEFVHCSILDSADTVETSALMKNDKIRVQRNQEKQRKVNADSFKEIRDTDRKYFQQMRTLLPHLNPSPLKSDVIFHCKGKIKDEKGYKQEVLSTFVRGHSAMIVKRCKWLARQIEAAKTYYFNDSNQTQHPTTNEDSLPVYGNNKNAVPIPETDGDLSWQVSRSGSNINIADNQNRANAVEDDYEDEQDDKREYFHSENIRSDYVTIENNESIRSTSPLISSFVGMNTNNNLQVTLMHPPEAVKLLLEYCYTNRVVPLGFEAFRMSYKPVAEVTIGKEIREYIGPVEPFTKSSWPHEGMPTVSLSVALAGIRLAEEACLPRLSLMCEVAASQLVNSTSLLEALALCEEQHKKTGNKLLYLRKEVMHHHILGLGPYGVSEISTMPSFQRTLRDKCDLVVPSLLMGLLETMEDEVFDNNDCKFDSEGLRIQRMHSTTHHFAK